MTFDHERMDVYSVSLDFIVIANDIIEAMPAGRAHLADQLARASTSIVLNIAEGAGKYHKPDKRRYYLTACGSATECAAILDICNRLHLINTETQHRGKQELTRIVSMLTRLARALEEA